MSRKVLGVSESLHKEFDDLAKKVNLPMTVVLETLVHHTDGIDWKATAAAYELRKPSWANIKRIVQDYQGKFPESTDSQLAALTGFSIAQVETVTHTAHKRVILEFNKNKRLKAKGLAVKAGVSERFANRILEQINNGAKVPKSERYLYENS